MIRILIALIACLSILTGCNLIADKQPTPFPTLDSLASPTALFALPPTTTPDPFATVIVSLPTVDTAQPASFAPTPTVGGILPGTPSGPYAVIGVVAGDALNIRSGPGINYPVVGTFPPTTTNIMRTGTSSSVGGVLWVEVQNPGGGNGWVHSGYLTEYVTPTTFCADPRVTGLISSFGEALKTSNGTQLAALISPASGWSVKLWRNGNTVVFHRSDAPWVFASTYQHHWGAAPGSGQDTVGAIHTVVLPKLLDVFNAPAPGYSMACDSVQAGGASYDTSWPATYANLNFYSLYKPGPAGNELSWRTLLIGIEYVQAQPYIFSTTQLDWEP